MDEYEDGYPINYFLDILYSLESYSFENFELKFFFNNGENYLLYKPFKINE